MVLLSIWTKIRGAYAPFYYARNRTKFDRSGVFVAFRYKDMTIQIKACILYGNMQ